MSEPPRRDGKTEKGSVNMIRIIGVLLTLIGIVGLVLSGFIVELGVASLPGTLAALLSGIAFLWLCRVCGRRNGDG